MHHRNTGNAITETFALADHKDWDTNKLYLHTKNAQLAPSIQSLQAPLFLSTGRGRVLSIAALAAEMRSMDARIRSEIALERHVSDAQDVVRAFDVVQTMADALHIMVGQSLGPNSVVSNLNVKLAEAIKLVGQLGQKLTTGRAHAHGLILDAEHQRTKVDVPTWFQVITRLAPTVHIAAHARPISCVVGLIC